MEENKNMEMALLILFVVSGVVVIYDDYGLACAVIVILGLFTVCAVTAIIQKFVEYRNNRADRGCKYKNEKHCKEKINYE